MLHEPAPVIDTVDPTTAHWPLPVKFTGRPELADALIENAASPKTLSPNDSNVMVWGTATS
jgi:hypothetical protein